MSYHKAACLLRLTMCPTEMGREEIVVLILENKQETRSVSWNAKGFSYQHSHLLVLISALLGGKRYCLHPLYLKRSSIKRICTVISVDSSSSLDETFHYLRVPMQSCHVDRGGWQVQNSF